MMLGRMSWSLVLAALLVAGAAGQQATQTDRQYQAALHKEMVERDLKGAIEDYKKIANSSDRALAAKALFRMAECYQKLGDAEATKIYTQLVRDFGGFPEAAEARTRLAVLGTQETTTSASSEPRRAWTPTVSGGECCRPGRYQYGKISRTGRYLPFHTYGDPGGLFVRDLRTGTNRHLVARADRAVDRSSSAPTQLLPIPERSFPDYASVMSPDERSVAYMWWQGSEQRWELRVIDLQGSSIGRPRVLVGTRDADPWPFDWSPDGRWLAVLMDRRDRTKPIVLVSPKDGTQRVLMTNDWRGWTTDMAFSPDSRFLAFDLPQPDATMRDIKVVAVDGSREIQIPSSVTSDETLFGWSPDGTQLLFDTDRTGSRSVWAMPIGPDGAGEPRLIKRDIGPVLSRGLTANGSVYYITEQPGSLSDVKVAAFDFDTGQIAAAPRVAVREFVGTNSLPTWSHDGKLLAYLSRRQGFGTADAEVLALRPIDSDRPLELRPKLEQIRSLTWAPDDLALLVDARDLDQGRRGIYSVDVRTGRVSPVAGGGIKVQWSPDGQRMYYLKQLADSPSTAMLFERLGTTGDDREVGRLDLGIMPGISEYAVSPDGRTVYYSRGLDAPGRLESPAGRPRGHALIALDLASGRQQEVAQVGFRWSLSPDGRFVATRVTNGPSLWALRIIPLDGGDVLDLAPMGEPFAGPLQWARDSRSLLAYVAAPTPTGRDSRVLWWIPVDGRPGRQIDLDSRLTSEARLDHLALHPDGRRLVFVHQPVSLDPGGPRTHLWVLDNPFALAKR